MNTKFKIRVSDIDPVNNTVLITVPIYDLVNLKVALVCACNTLADPPESIRKLKNELLDLCRAIDTRPNRSK